MRDYYSKEENIFKPSASDLSEEAKNEAKNKPIAKEYIA